MKRHRAKTAAVASCVSRTTLVEWKERLDARSQAMKVCKSYYMSPGIGIDSMGKKPMGAEVESDDPPSMSSGTQIQVNVLVWEK